jgi:hypothetical protein
MNVPFSFSGLEEGLEVAVLVKDLVAGVAAVEDVVTNVADRGARRARHVPTLPPSQDTHKRKR